MNILEHILAGHYPTDSKGRSLVPLAGNKGTLVVCATDRPGFCPILGFRAEDGRDDGDHPFSYYPDSHLLLPPPPRKVKVIAWALVDRSGKMVSVGTPKPAGTPWEMPVELTGEYEEPWS